MAKSKTYTYEGEGAVTVVVPGRGEVYRLEPGDTIDAETEAEQAALEANPDLTAGKGKARKKDKDD